MYAWFSVCYPSSGINALLLPHSGIDSGSLASHCLSQHRNCCSDVLTCCALFYIFVGGSCIFFYKSTNDLFKCLSSINCLKYPLCGLHDFHRVEQGSNPGSPYGSQVDIPTTKLRLQGWLESLFPGDSSVLLEFGKGLLIKTLPHLFLFFSGSV